MKRCTSWSLSLLVLLAAPSLALAQQAYAVKDLHLRAGPARDYPVVAVLPSGTDLAVQGCLGDYTWCDVVTGPLRGWVYAGNIDYGYQGNWVPVLGYGPQLGIGIVGFVLGNYWSSYYGNQPWYRDRDRWLRHPPLRLRPPPHRPMPLPPPHSGPPRPHPPMSGEPGPGRLRPQLPRPIGSGRPPAPQRSEVPQAPPQQRGVPPRAQPPQRGAPGGAQGAPRERGDREH